jgi:hypothetical protein
LKKYKKTGYLSSPPKKSLYKKITQDKITLDNLIRNIFKPYVLSFLRKKENKKTFGNENADKIFYIIGFPRNKDGLLFIILCNLSHIAYSLNKGYIPIVDLQNYDNQYLDSGTLYKENSWEYYFDQPMGFTMDSINKSRNIIISNKLQMPNLDYKIDFYIFNNQDRLLYFRNVFKSYIKFNNTTTEYLSNELNFIMADKKKVLGVLCRGTDYLLKKPAGHPRQPEPAEVIDRARQVMKDFNCSHIYLATEDMDIYDLFKQNFSDKLLTNNQKRYRSKDLENIDFISQIEGGRKRDKYLLGLEYLSSLNILSKCSCFIGGRTAGTVGVYLMTDGFEYDYVWDKGFYPLPPLSNAITKKFKFLLG